eukprot:10179324-Alexandrium_andersonii.AAC.1
MPCHLHCSRCAKRGMRNGRNRGRPETQARPAGPKTVHAKRPPTGHLILQSLARQDGGSQ